MRSWWIIICIVFKFHVSSMVHHWLRLSRQLFSIKPHPTPYPPFRQSKNKESKTLICRWLWQWVTEAIKDKWMKPHSELLSPHSLQLSHCTKNTHTLLRHKSHDKNHTAHVCYSIQVHWSKYSRKNKKHDVCHYKGANCGNEFTVYLFLIWENLCRK